MCAGLSQRWEPITPSLATSKYGPCLLIERSLDEARSKTFSGLAAERYGTINWPAFPCYCVSTYTPVHAPICLFIMLNLYLKQTESETCLNTVGSSHASSEYSSLNYSPAPSEMVPDPAACGECRSHFAASSRICQP